MLTEQCSLCTLETAEVGCMYTNYSAELTKHGSVAPVHRLGWGQRGLLGALRRGGWG